MLLNVITTDCNDYWLQGLHCLLSVAEPFSRRVCCFNEIRPRPMSAARFENAYPAKSGPSKIWIKNQIRFNSRKKHKCKFVRWCLCVADYTAFVKRVVRLVQTYLSVKNVELEMRPFTDDDEALDVRGQPLTSTSSSAPIKRAPPSATVDADNDDVQLTSRVDNEDRLVAKESKARKKRRSSRKSEGTVEELATEEVDEGFSLLNYVKWLVSFIYLFIYLLN